MKEVPRQAHQTAQQILGILPKIYSLVFHATSQASKRRGFLRTMRAAFRAIPILVNPVGHIRLLRLMSHPHVAGLAHRHPDLVYKYLWSAYLSRGFSRRTRLAILINHYAYFKDQVSETFFAEAFDCGHVLWQENLEEHVFDITLAFAREHDYEGDLHLDFQCDNELLCRLTFIVAPGATIGVASEQVLLVTAIQGARGKLELMRLATKICHGTSPAHMLIATAEALALYFGIRMIAGVGTEQQVAKKSEEEQRFVFDYDGFWESFVGPKGNGEFYLAPVPFPEKPVESFKSNRRSRVQRRREFKSRIAKQIHMYLEQDSLQH